MVHILSPSVPYYMTECWPVVVRLLSRVSGAGYCGSEQLISTGCHAGLLHTLVSYVTVGS